MIVSANTIIQSFVLHIILAHTLIKKSVNTRFFLYKIIKNIFGFKNFALLKKILTVIEKLSFDFISVIFKKR